MWLYIEPGVLAKIGLAIMWPDWSETWSVVTSKSRGESVTWVETDGLNQVLYNVFLAGVWLLAVHTGLAYF